MYKIYSFKSPKIVWRNGTRTIQTSKLHRNSGHKPAKLALLKVKNKLSNFIFRRAQIFEFMNFFFTFMFKLSFKHSVMICSRWFHLVAQFSKNWKMYLACSWFEPFIWCHKIIAINLCKFRGVWRTRLWEEIREILPSSKWILNVRKGRNKFVQFVLIVFSSEAFVGFGVRKNTSRKID